VWWSVALPEPELSLVVFSTASRPVARMLESAHASVQEAGLAG
jgi:hypothetical protein